MKRLLHIIVISTLIVTLSGCKDGREKGQRVYLHSYIMEYFETQGIIFTPHSNPYDVIGMEIGRGEVVCDYVDKGEKQVLYEALSKKYGDISFDRTVTFYTHYPPYPSAQAYSLVSIEITSDTEFDENHPAGTSLADLVTISYSSVKPFIDSDYKGYQGPVSSRYETNFKKPLSEIGRDDLQLLYFGEVNNTKANISLLFERQPILSKEHLMTITCTDDRGRVFTGSIEMTFE
jgi:hypothetical protein